MRSTAWLFLASAMAFGCGGDLDATEDPTSIEEVTVREGDYDLMSANGGGQPYVAVAINGSNALLAKGWEGIHVVDLRTMRVSRRLTQDSQRVRLRADGMQSLGRGNVLLWYQGNVLGDLEDNRQLLFVDVYNATSNTITRSVEIDLTGTYESGTGLNDLPSTGAWLDSASGQLFVTFSHLRRQDKVYAVPMPTARRTQWSLARLPNAQSWNVEMPNGLTVRDGVAYVASHDDGLFALDVARGTSRRVSNAVGYAVGTATARNTGFVANHNGSLFVVDLRSGRTLAEREVPGFSDGLALSGAQVFVVWRNGLTVLRDRWSSTNN